MIRTALAIIAATVCVAAQAEDGPLPPGWSLHFWTLGPGCPPCMAFEQNHAGRFGGQLVRLEWKHNRQTAEEMGIQSWPVFQLVHNGTSHYRWPGLTDADTIIRKSWELAGQSGPPESPTVHVVEIPPDVVQTAWGTITLSTYQRCGDSRCDMCAAIMAMKRAREAAIRASRMGHRVPAAPQPPQQPADGTGADQQGARVSVIMEALEQLDLQPEDTLVDLGSGDGRVLILAAAMVPGLRCVGVEINPELAKRSRQSVAAAGLSSQVTIVTGDAVDFRPQDYGATALYVYQFPGLLTKLAPVIRGAGVRTVSALHAVPGLSGGLRGDGFWYYGR